MQLPEYHQFLLDALKNEKSKSNIPDRCGASSEICTWSCTTWPFESSVFAAPVMATGKVAGSSCGGAEGRGSWRGRQPAVLCTCAAAERRLPAEL